MERYVFAKKRKAPAAAGKGAVNPFSSLGPNYKKCVVTSLMDVTENIMDHHETFPGSGVFKAVKKRKFVCPRPSCSKKETHVLQNARFTNPFNHLVSCYSGQKALGKSYFDAANMSKLSPSDAGIHSYFHAASATEEHTDLYR